jgi:hypothetical protein
MGLSATPNSALHLTGPAFWFFKTSCSLQPAGK